MLTSLAEEAQKKTEAAKFKLGLLASQGDERARAMLEQLEKQGTVE